jgi:TRAP-type uncharacterized transport system fused permease subunit
VVVVVTVLSTFTTADPSKEQAWRITRYFLLFAAAAFGIYGLALAGFMIPYIFVYNPGLLLIDTTLPEIILMIGTSLLGAFALALGGSGYWMRNLNILERIIFFGAAVTLIFPGVVTDSVGVGIMAVMWFLQKRSVKNLPQQS